MGNEDDDQERKSTKRKDSTKSAEVSTKCSIAIESCASGRDNFAQQPSTSSAMILMGADQRRCSSTSSSDSNKSTQSSFSSSSSTSSSPSEEDDDSDVEEGRQASKKRRHKQRRVTATADDLNAHEYRPGADDDGDLTGDALRPGTARSMPTTSKRNAIFRLQNYSYEGAEAGPSSSVPPGGQLPLPVPPSSDAFSPPHSQNYFLPGYDGSSGGANDSGGVQLRRRPTDPSGGNASSTTVCFGLLMVHSTFITLFVFDFLLLSHSLIFTVTSYLNGEHRYKNGEAHMTTIASTKLTTMPPPFLVTPGDDESKLGNDERVDLSDVSGITSMVPYELLLPLFALEVFWLISGVMALAALKFVQPLLQISYIAISGLVIMATIWLIVTNVSKIVYLAGGGQSAFHLPLALTISCANLIFFTQIYFLYIKIMCIRILFRKRKSVVSTNVSATTSTVMNLEAGGHSGGSGNRTSLMSGPLPASVSSAVNVMSGKDYVKRMTKVSFEKAECDCCYETDNGETYSTKSTIIITDDFR